MKHPEFAKHWAHMLGADTEGLVQLSGGINNHVFLCGSQQRNWVVKAYPSQKPGQRDRMQAEVDFLRYSAHVAPGFTPMLLEVDAVRRCVVMEHIAGDAYPEGASPSQKDLQAAFSFFGKLNSNLGLAKEMIRMDAAEGFLSLRQHMANVLERLSVMGTEHLPHQYKAEASVLLNQLFARAEGVGIRLEAQMSAGIVEDALNPDDLHVSPSDFGFHNAVSTTKGVRFIDFEFAGWDDPAKSCVDFTLQQRNPIHLGPIDVAAQFFPGKETLMGSRINAMMEILSLKWLCIILGILNPAKLTQMINARLELTPNSAVATQLRRYHEYLKNRLPYQPP